MQTFPQGEQAQQKTFLRYLGVVCTLTFLLWLAPFFLLHFHLLPAGIETSRYTHILSYPFTVKADADVVLFGDSSVLFGIDPKVVGQQTGLRVINLPNIATSLPVTKDLPLQAYLRHNRMPRLIVFYLSPWDLNFIADPLEPGNSFEGDETLLRNGTVADFMRYALHHPGNAAVIPFRTYTLLHLERTSAGEQIEADLGHVVPFLTADRGPLKTPCAVKPPWVKKSNQDTVSELASKYAQSTNVLVYISPIPACAGAETLESRSYAAVKADPPHVLPPSTFLNDEMYSHPLPSADHDVSQLLANAISRRLNIQASTASATPSY